MSFSWEWHLEAHTYGKSNLPGLFGIGKLLFIKFKKIHWPKHCKYFHDRFYQRCSCHAYQVI